MKKAVNFGENDFVYITSSHHSEKSHARVAVFKFSYLKIFIQLSRVLIVPISAVFIYFSLFLYRLLDSDLYLSCLIL
jgi:hypothetical protein